VQRRASGLYQVKRVVKMMRNLLKALVCYAEGKDLYSLVSCELSALAGVCRCRRSSGRSSGRSRGAA